MDAHRIEVLDRTYDHHVVAQIAHYLQLVFLPADDRLLDQRSVHRRRIERALDDFFVFLEVVCDSSARASQGERRSNNRRVSDRLYKVAPFIDRVNISGARHAEADLFHHLFEQQAIFSNIDGVEFRAYQLDVELLENTTFGEAYRQVQRGLAAYGGEQRIRALSLDHAADSVEGEGLDIGSISQLRVGHDRGRVRVD